MLGQINLDRSLGIGETLLKKMKKYLILLMMITMLMVVILIISINFMTTSLVQYLQWLSALIIVISIVMLLYLFIMFQDIMVNNYDNYFIKGYDYLKYKKYDEAIDSFNKAIHYNKNYPEAFIGRGVAYFKIKLYDQAMADFDRVSLDERVSYDFYYYKGLLNLTKYQNLLTDTVSSEMNYIGHKMLESAVDDFTKAMKIYPLKGNVFFLRGLSFYYKEDLPAAIADFNKVLKMTPAIRESYVYRGLAYCKINELEKAWNDLQELRHSDFPGMQNLIECLSNAYFDRGHTFHKEGKFSEAWEDFTRAKVLGNKRAAEIQEELRKVIPIKPTQDVAKQEQKPNAIEALETLMKELKAQQERTDSELDGDAIVTTVGLIKSQINATREALETLINNVEAQRDKTIPDRYADALIMKARLIITHLFKE